MQSKRSAIPRALQLSDNSGMMEHCPSMFFRNHWPTGNARRRRTHAARFELRTARREVVKQSESGLKDRHPTAQGNALGMLARGREEP
jgi:hypothetical protein